MPVRSGFFDSSSGDRMFATNDFNILFGGIISDGVLQSVGNGLVVSASSGMNVVVETGRAWFNESWINNDGQFVITIPTQTPPQNRIDTIVLNFDKSTAVRENTIIRIAGTPSSSPVPPTLIYDSLHKQIPIADIYVSGGAVQIIQANITNRIGSGACPFSTGLLDSFDITAALAQWDSEFNTWFHSLETILDENTAANLLTMITQTQASKYSDRNLLINASMEVDQRGSATTTTSVYAGPDRWLFEINAAGTWNIDRVADVYGEKSWYHARCSVAAPLPTSAAYCKISQRLEGHMLQDSLKGTANAKPMYLSFIVRSNKTGTYIAELFDQENVRQVSLSYTIDVANVNKEIVLPFPEDVSGPISADDVHRFTLSLWLVAGSTFRTGVLNTVWNVNNNGNRASGQENLAATVNNEFYVTNVQLISSWDEKPFQYVPQHLELERSMRYFERINSYKPIIGASTGVGRMFVPYKVRKRSTPNFTIYSLQAAFTDYVFTSLANLEVVNYGGTEVRLNECAVSGTHASISNRDSLQGVITMDVSSEL